MVHRLHRVEREHRKALAWTIPRWVSVTRTTTSILGCYDRATVEGSGGDDATQEVMGNADGSPLSDKRVPVGRWQVRPTPWHGPTRWTQ